MERVFSFAGGSLPLGFKTYIMGILNVTPDSFYDGGRYFDPAAAVKKAVSLASEGADIIDIGALSTRPGGERATEEEELRRIASVLPEIRKEVKLPLSVDTYRPAVARCALDTGADIVNDVSGAFSPALAALVKEYGAGWVLNNGTQVAQDVISEGAKVLSDGSLLLKTGKLISADGTVVNRFYDFTVNLFGHTYTVDWIAVFWIGAAFLSMVCALTVWNARPKQKDEEN